MKSLTFRIVLVFSIAFVAGIFALGYLVGSRPEFYNTNMAVRIQHLSNALQRCRLYLERTRGNTAKSAAMLKNVKSIATELSKCEEQASSISLLQEECKNRYEQEQSNSYEEPIVRSDSDIYQALMSVRSQAGTGSIGELLRNIDGTDQVQKKQVIRVLVKDIVEKREITRLVNANCNASVAAWRMKQAPPPTAPPVALPVAAPKKPKEAVEDEAADETPRKPVRAPKRPRDEDVEEVAPPPRRKPKREEDEEDPVMDALMKRKRPKKPVVEEEEEEVAPPPRRRKKKPAVADE